MNEADIYVTKMVNQFIPRDRSTTKHTPSPSPFYFFIFSLSAASSGLVLLLVLLLAIKGYAKEYTHDIPLPPSSARGGIMRQKLQQFDTEIATRSVHETEIATIKLTTENMLPNTQ